MYTNANFAKNCKTVDVIFLLFNQKEFLQTISIFSHQLDLFLLPPSSVSGRRFQSHVVTSRWFRLQCCPIFLYYTYLGYLMPSPCGQWGGCFQDIQQTDELPSPASPVFVPHHPPSLSFFFLLFPLWFKKYIFCPHHRFHIHWNQIAKNNAALHKARSAESDVLGAPPCPAVWGYVR